MIHQIGNCCLELRQIVKNCFANVPQGGLQRGIHIAPGATITLHLKKKVVDVSAEAISFPWGGKHFAHASGVSLITVLVIDLAIIPLRLYTSIQLVYRRRQFVAHLEAHPDRRRGTATRLGVQDRRRGTLT